MWQLHGSKVHFRGAKGLQSIQRLGKAIGLLTPECSVFMCVCSMHLGRKLQTQQRGYMEKQIVKLIPGIHVIQRMVDENLHVRLQCVCPKAKDWWPTIKRALGDTLGFPDGQTPTSLHIRVAFHGHVQLRVGFDNPEWSDQLEQATLDFCYYLGTQIMQCC